MYIEIDQSADSPMLALREPDDFTAFKILIRQSASRLPLAEALGGLGTASDDGHALVQVAAVKQLAGARAGDSEWTAGFDQMVAYAARSGWMSDDGRAIRAHCETEAADA
jgi:hypothetical protein